MYRSGQDVSVVGSTWIDIFISMNTLRPFTPREVAEIGGPQAFLPAAWQSGLLGLPVTQTVWAIPRTSDTRLIFYRRDLLQRAGIDEPPFTTDPRYQAVVQSLKAGKSFRATYMWGLVEERIGAVLSELWRSILTDPSLDLARVVPERLEALARRLDSILAG